jgi:2-dehydro-3-deoxy-D-arabinonate dehydratase
MGARRIVKTNAGWGLLGDEGHVLALCHPLVELLQGAPLDTTDEVLTGDWLAPVDEQEIWAAGVTYGRSLEARMDESQEPDVYDRVYEADRPELFFKSTAARVIGPGGTGCIRSDSTWDVPEPEVALVLDAEGRVWGYTIGDDVSSRSIEGENPLYLPQAKVYEGACVLGPWIVPAADVEPPFDISLRIQRGDEVAFEAETSTSKMRRSFDELAQWLFAGMTFPQGAVLLTGTGIVPGDDETLRAGDVVTITVDGLGALSHGISEWSR